MGEVDVEVDSDSVYSCANDINFRFLIEDLPLLTCRVVCLSLLIAVLFTLMSLLLLRLLLFSLLL